MLKDHFVGTKITPTSIEEMKQAITQVLEGHLPVGIKPWKVEVKPDGATIDVQISNADGSGEETQFRFKDPNQAEAPDFMSELKQV
jgi:hypothetical protein